MRDVPAIPADSANRTTTAAAFPYSLEYFLVSLIFELLQCSNATVQCTSTQDCVLNSCPVPRGFLDSTYFDYDVIKTNKTEVNGKNTTRTVQKHSIDIPWPHLVASHRKTRRTTHLHLDDQSDESFFYNAH
jgi:hypothetical protein